MKNRYRLYRRNKRGNYYLHDEVTGKQQSTRTKDKAEAQALCVARNQAVAQPALNVSMAKAYLSGKSPELATRTWQSVMDDKAAHYEQQGARTTLKRWQRVCRSAPFSNLRNIVLIETESDHFLKVLRHTQAGVSTNVQLRILHNHALDMGWLLSPVLPKKAWPKVKYGEKTGITSNEHQRLISDAKDDPEWKRYLETLWETGGAQSDIAVLDHFRIDWEQDILLYRRMKTENRHHEYAKVRMGSKLKGIIAQCPDEGYFFPNIAAMSLENRARKFRNACRRLKIKDKTLHCYRYSWAERAKAADVPQRAAMEVLGHQSRIVHAAYAKNADVTNLPLEFYEQQKAGKIVQFEQAVGS